MYQALYRKWRPKSFADVIGQEHITATLEKQVADGRLSHAYLFTGTRGTGKTTCAKILAKAVNCENPENGNPCNKCPSCLGIDSGAFLDVTELDAASNNGVDHVRALRDEAIYSPAQVKRRVYIIDEVHMLSISAFNALLKILEEPPEHLMFILATTELHKVPATILSRCQRFSFRRILPRDIAARMEYVAAKEGIDLRRDGAELLSRLADGALRDALSLLDQCAVGGGTVDSERVLDTLGLAGNLQTAQLMDLILRHDAKAALLLLHKLHAGGKDMGAVLGELSTLTRDLLIARTAPEGGAALLTGGYDERSMQSLQALASAERLISMATILQKTNADLYLSTNRRTDAELCLMRLCDESLSGDVSALAARIARLEEQLSAGASFAARQSAAPAAPAAAPAPAPKAVPATAPKREEPVDLPWRDEPPLPEEPSFERVPFDEAPPMPEPPAARDAAPAPARDNPPAPAAKPLADGDTKLWDDLLESYKNHLPPMLRAFLNKAHGRLEGDTMTVYCATDIDKKMIDNEQCAEAIRAVTSAAAGKSVGVRFVVGEIPGGERDPMDDLLRLGSKFDNFNIK